ncbi:ABC transporter permease [Microbacterium oleivorans]|uniref:ABC transporter permease n=1 Tax=Microbacterium oleivorans TaxID=273677 RepID=UPI001E4BC280|nr:ABC transporter permease [Microbacterium oleivorans]
MTSLILADSPPQTAGRFGRSLRSELRNVRTTRGTRWALGLTAALWVVVGAGVAAIALLVDAESVSISGALLGMGAAVTVFVPILAIFIMAADWQSRDVLTTFALEPRRHIVFLAKALTALIVCTVLVAVAAVLAVVFTAGLALAAGATIVWNADAESIAVLLWSAGVGTVSGIAYGAATQRVAIAIVFSLVQGFVIDPLLMLVPHGIGSWFRLTAITEAGSGTGELGPALTAGLLWLVVPLAIGFARNQRADVQ